MKISAVWNSDAVRRDAIRDMLNLEDGLSKWESDFLDSISQQDFAPTKKQIETLDKIRKQRGY